MQTASWASLTRDQKREQEVKECCRRLIETCAPGGGYVLAGGAGATEAKAENLRAFMEAALEYGVYSRMPSTG